MNMQQLKDEILTKHALDLIAKLGTNGTYPTDSGFQITIRDKTVTTILN